MTVNTRWALAYLALFLCKTPTLTGKDPQSILFLRAERWMAVISLAAIAVTFEEEPVAKVLLLDCLRKAFVNSQRLVQALTFVSLQTGPSLPGSTAADLNGPFAT